MAFPGYKNPLVALQVLSSCIMRANPAQGGSAGTEYGWLWCCRAPVRKTSTGT